MDASRQGSRAVFREEVSDPAVENPPIPQQPTIAAQVASEDNSRPRGIDAPPIAVTVTMTILILAVCGVAVFFHQGGFGAASVSPSGHNGNTLSNRSKSNTPQHDQEAAFFPTPIPAAHPIASAAGCRLRPRQLSIANEL